MDSTRFNTRVLKEPRGMIRIIQLIFAILAFSTTTSFDTQTSFTISCYQSNSQQQIQFQKQTIYPVEYPFDLRDVPLKYLSKCSNNAADTKTLDMDFSFSAQFFVATGVLCFLYTIGSLFVYVAGSTYYETNPLFPVLDLVVTAVFSIFWLSGASAWAANVSDLKYYTGPRHLISQLSHCNQTVNKFNYDCFPESPGKWSTLYISLIFGFANLFLWSSSMWFVYKETTFHRKTLQPQPTTGSTTYPGINDNNMAPVGMAGVPQTTMPQPMQQNYGQFQQQNF